MTQDEIEEIAFKWTGKRSARNVDADTFMEACERGDISFVRTALEHNKSLANASDKSGITALMCATRDGHKDIAKLLLNEGANVNAVDEFEMTPLMRSVGDNRDFPEVVQLLLEAGAYVNYTSKTFQQTALDMAQIGGLEESIAILKTWGGVKANTLQ